MEVDREALRALAQALDVIRECLEIEGIIHEGNAQVLADASRKIAESGSAGDLQSRSPPGE